MACLQAIYGASTFSQPTVHCWWVRFRSGETDIRDQPRPGAVRKRTTEKIQEVKDFVESNRRMTLQDVSVFCDVSRGTAHTILCKHLQKSKRPAKWIPHNLTQANKD